MVGVALHHKALGAGQAELSHHSIQIGGTIIAVSYTHLEGGHHIHTVIRTVGDVFAPVVNVQGEILALKAGPVVIVRDRNVLSTLKREIWSINVAAMILPPTRR